MPTYSDPWVSAQWLYSTLNVSAVTTLATGGIHRGLARDSVSGNKVDPPYVIITAPTAQSDLMVVGTVRVWSPQFWDVIAVGTRLQWETVSKIVAAVDVLLHGKTAQAPSSGNMYECTREGVILPYFEVDEGVQYVYEGGTYWIKAIAT